MLCIWIWYLIVTAAVGTVGIDSYCKCKNSEDIELIPPFGCGDKFALEGCNGSDGSVLWHGFSDDPTVISIFNNNNYTDYSYIDLTWNQENVDKTCPLPMSQDGFPLQIDLRPTDFHFSELNVFLFLNCSSDSNFSIGHWYGIDSSPNCKSYSKQCMTDINENGKCVELLLNRSTINNVLNITETGSLWNCTHFQAIVMKPDNKWKWGMIELGWSSRSFKNCTASDNCNKNGNAGNEIAIIAGLTSAAFGVIVFLVLIILCCQRQRRHNKKFYMKDDGISSLMYEHPVEFSYKTVQTITKSFAVKIGEGGFGVVYRGAMPNPGIQLAVKVLDPESRQTDKQFLNEVATIGSIHHMNVVRLLGFCTEKSNRILVYEFVANGSLDRWLFKPQTSVLSWKQRYSIALGVARGLLYLHEECRHKIVHCDIKPQNILLNENMNPKISDFGLSKLIARKGNVSIDPVVTMAKGTPGYVAPEFWMGGESHLTTKFDVYSYGMMLFELISGRHNFSEQGGCFPVEAYEASMNNQFDVLLDKRLNCNGILHTDLCLIHEQVRRITLVALWCVQDLPARRPSMKEVLLFVEGSVDVPEKPPAPAVLTMSELYSSVKLGQEPQGSHLHKAMELSCGR